VKIQVALNMADNNSSLSRVRLWFLSCLFCLIVIVSVVAGPQTLWIWPVGLAALFIGPNSSSNLTPAAIVYPCLLYAALFAGILFGPAKWIRFLFIVLAVVLLLNIGGCVLMMARLRGIH
jgi:hypothetical protein